MALKYLWKKSVRWIKTRLQARPMDASKAHRIATKVRWLPKIPKCPKTKKLILPVSHKTYPWGKTYVMGGFPLWMHWDFRQPQYLLVNIALLYPLWLKYLGLEHQEHLYDTCVQNCRRYIKEMYTAELDPAPPEMRLIDLESQEYRVPEYDASLKYNSDMYFNHRAAGKFMRNINNG